jgi:signal transduction histidine kinase
LVTEKEDTNKVNTLFNLIDVYFKEFDIGKVLIAANQALSISTQIDFQKGKGIAFLDLSAYYYLTDQYDESKKDANLALKIFEEVKDKSKIAESYLELGGLDMLLGNTGETLKFFYAALKIYEELKDNKQIANCLSAIGLTYYQAEDYEQSLIAYTGALNKYKEMNTEIGSEQCYIYIANIYNVQKKYREALNYDSTGLKISIAEGNKLGQAWAYSCMGDILFQQIDLSQSNKSNNQQTKSLMEALKNYEQSLNNYRDVGDGGGMGDTYERVSEVDIRLHKFSEAKKYADSALLIAKKINAKDNLEKSYQVLAKVDSAQGNYKQAYEHYKLHILYRDSIINEEAKRKSLQTSMQYDFDKKESIAKAEQDKKDAEAKRIKNQQYFAIAALGVLGLAVLIIALIQFRNNKQKQKANLLITRQKQKVEATLTELKSTQAQLIQSEKMASLGELTAGIAHEIQNPLNFVNNFSEVNTELIDELKEERKKEIRDFKNEDDILNDIKENEQKINHHGKRADAIVKGMLQHSRSSTGVKEPTNINALADEYLRLSYHGLRAKDKSFNANFKTDFDESIGNINIVPQDIGRVLLNLYNNAFYAVTEKAKQKTNGYEPTISVSSKKVNNRVELTVKDNGNGIPQKVVDKIFQPFFTTKPTGEGTGLGLSLSYDIVKAHGGELKVETKEGEGSRFIIDLPA